MNPLKIFSTLLSKLIAVLMNIFGPLLGCLIFASIPTIILSIPAWIALKKHNCLFWWDLGFTIYAMIFWVIGLVLFQSKGESLVNIFYEPMIVGALSVIALYARTGIATQFFSGNQKVLSLISIVMLFFSVLILRYFFPVLPE
jgi:hypothetical protein